MPYEISLGGTGSVTAAGARKKLGLEVGTDIQPYDSDLQALADNNGTGFWSVTGSGTGSTRTIQGTANQIAVTNGDGVSGNPVISLTSSIIISGSFSGTSGTFGGVTVDSNRVYRTVDDSGFTIFGGAANNGANIELYGGTHATLANRIYYDADVHTFRRQDATSGTSFVVNGTVTATSFSGDGSSLTNINSDFLDGEDGTFYQNASNLISGTVPDARITGAYTGLTDLTGSGTATFNLFSGSGASLTSLNANNLSSGTVPSARISGSYTGITGVGVLSAGSISSTFGNIDIGASSFTGDGTNIINVDAALLGGQNGSFYQNASNLSSGTLPAARFNDTAHGNRSGGSLHATATTGTAGFMSSSDKTKLDGLGAPITSESVQSTTSGTTKDFTGIPSGTTMIIIDFDETRLDGNEHILVQIGDSGGLETSGYTSSGVVNFDSGGGSGVISSVGFIVYQGGANRGYSGHMVLLNITSNTWTSSHSGMLHGTGDADSLDGGGRKVLSGTLDRIRVTRTGSASFNAGQVNIHYV